MNLAPGPTPPPAWHIARDLLAALDPALWTIPTVPPDLPRGDGHAVLFAPGLATGDYATLPWRSFFAALGYETHGWDAGVNIGPTRGALSTLERRLFELNDRTGKRVSLVGRSLGGMMVREFAKAHPDRVRRLILVCAPVRHPVASHLGPLLLALDRLYASDHPRSPEMLNRPAPVETTAIYSRSDGFIAWPCCCEEPGPLAENIEVSGGHCGAGLDPVTLRVIATRLARPERP